MATLTTAVDGDDLYLVVSDLPTTHFIQLDDEIVEIEAEFATIYDRRTGTTLPNKLRVLRAALGTSAASHSGGATLVAVYGAGSGGAGSLTLDNTVDPPAEVTTIIAAGAVIAGGEATLSGVLLTGGETEPGHFFRGPDAPEDTPEYLAILEAGDLWTDTTGGLPFQHKVWNGGQWDLVPLVLKDAEGVEIAEVSMNPATREVLITTVNGAATNDTALSMFPDGVTLRVGPGEIGAYKIYDDGQIEIKSAWGSLYMTANGVEFGGNLYEWTGEVILALPIADPVNAGQLWADAGVVKVSAG